MRHAMEAVYCTLILWRPRLLRIRPWRDHVGNISFYQECTRLCGRSGKRGFDHRKVDTFSRCLHPTVVLDECSAQAGGCRVDVLVTYGAPPHWLRSGGKGIRSSSPVSTAERSGVSAKMSPHQFQDADDEPAEIFKKLTPLPLLSSTVSRSLIRRVSGRIDRLESQFGFQTVRMASRDPEMREARVAAGRTRVYLGKRGGERGDRCCCESRMPPGSHDQPDRRYGGTRVILSWPNATSRGGGARFTARMFRVRARALPAEVPSW